MNTIHVKLQKADRLATITQKVGFALWQLQELEVVTAQYYVLVTQAKRGMGLAAGTTILDRAQSKTFGTTVNNLVKAKLLPTNIAVRFQKLLGERNWLVHSSRASSRNAIHSDSMCTRLLDRLERISEEALTLLKEIETHREVFVRKHGVRAEQIDEMAAQILQQWQGNETI